MPTTRQLLSSVARKGTGGDTDLAHVTRGDVVIPIEIQSDPLISAGLRGVFVKAGLDKKRFTVGTGKRNRATGLQAFAVDPNALYYQALASGQFGIAPPSTGGGLGPTSAQSTASAPAAGNQTETSDTPKTVGGQSLSDIVDQVGSGGIGAGANPGGEPGLAGTGAGKSAADIAVGSLMGMGPLGFAGSALAALGQLAASQQQGTPSSLTGAIFGNDPLGIFGGPTVDQLGTMGQNIDVNPSAYGLGLAPGDLSAAAATTADAINQGRISGSTTDPGFGGGGGFGAGSNVGGVAAGGAIGAAGGAGEQGILGGGGVSIGGGGIGGGVDSGGSGTGVGGTGAGSDSTGGGLGGTGAAGGETAKGGPVKGPEPEGKNKDNLTVNETGQGLQAGEHIVNRAAVKMVGRDKLNRLNRIAELREKAAEFTKVMQKLRKLEASAAA